MKIALIGRPNVGKSTLFNRLIGRRSAIVGDMPGITRDRKLFRGNICGFEFDILDTPGVDPFSKNELAKTMNEQSQNAIKEADVVFFLIDAVEGICEYDKAVVSWIRSAFKKVGNREIILIKNKCESKNNVCDPESLGFGEGVFVSAEHGIGMDDLYMAISKYDVVDEDENTDFQEKKSDIKIAIVGRPNVGKSTLINAIIGENRLLTGETAGITRDAIALEWTFKNRKISLIDTAGQRRKSKVEEKVESDSVGDAWKHIKSANVVVVVMDIQNPFENQDVTIARKAFDEGKIVVFALNKSDTVVSPEIILKSIEQRAVKEFAQLPGVACLLVSAKEKKGLARIFNTSFKLYDSWCQRISTSPLNRWFQRALEQNPIPLVNGRPIKLKYISQTNSRPPTFAIFANRADKLPSSYERYLLNNLRKAFGLEGVPLRVVIRQRENPYNE